METNARKPVVVLVDTREQDRWTFNGHGVRLRTATLATGDYSLPGLHRRHVVIERKTVEDLFHTMTRGRERFLREMERLSRFDLALLVIEGSIDRIRRGSRWSGAAPGRLLDSVFGFCMRYRVVPVFAQNRAEAQAIAFGVLKHYRIELAARRPKK